MFPYMIIPCFMGSLDPFHWVYLLRWIFWYKFNSLYGAHHLINAINKYFKWSIDWYGQNYLGLTLYWNYTKKYVNISMPGYIPTAFHKFPHKTLARTQDSPHKCNKPLYGKHIQLATQQRSAPKLKSTDKNCVQSINGTFLYYAWAVDPAMLPYLNEISTYKYAPAQEIKKRKMKSSAGLCINEPKSNYKL